MLTFIVPQNAPIIRETAQATHVDRIAYRPNGKLHPEQWRAKVNGVWTAVTPASARLVIDLARNPHDYRFDGLTRTQWGLGPLVDEGRKWWSYGFTANDFAQFLVEAEQ